jgi:hypothetical protein
MLCHLVTWFRIMFHTHIGRLVQKFLRKGETQVRDATASLPFITSKKGTLIKD